MTRPSRNEAIPKTRQAPSATPEASITVTFHPQAWVNDYAMSVDAEGPTTFTIPRSHLEEYELDALTYELHPYQALESVPAWIRSWAGPFKFEVHT